MAIIQITIRIITIGISDKNSFYQREIPFKNVDLVHSIINECLQYFMKKLRNLMSENSDDMTEHFKIMDIRPFLNNSSNI